MGEAKKRCHGTRLLHTPQNLACLGCPTTGPNTPKYCMRLLTPRGKKRLAGRRRGVGERQC